MNNQEIETRVRDVLVKVAQISEADRPKLVPNADLFGEVGVKSTAALDLLLSLEEEFGISIPDKEFGDARTIGALAALIGGLK